MTKPAFVCSHGCAYTEEELEAGMRMATIEYLMAAEEAEHELESDLAREAELARMHTLGESDCPWPWYADAPLEVVEPEQIT